MSNELLKLYSTKFYENTIGKKRSHLRYAI